jgi:hypothetical protein
MPVDRLEQSGLNRAWITAEAARSAGASKALTCASTSLQPAQRSDRWRAWATGPDEQRIEGEGDGPIAALNALARELRPLRGSRAADSAA